MAGSGYLRRTVVEPVRALMRQGATPRVLALSLAIGVVIGVFPVIGATTLLCLAVALGFRLNVIAMQIGNHLMYPLQVLLLVPFVRLGEAVFGAPSIPLSLEQVSATFEAGPWRGLTTFATSIGHAVVAWTLVAPLACAAVYVVLRPVLERATGAYARVRA